MPDTPYSERQRSVQVKAMLASGARSGRTRARM